jgi:hypothetical protein
MGLLVGVLCVAGLLAAYAVAAPAHTSPCHPQHTCPSDHHTYVWVDSGGAGWDCVEPGAKEYDPALDTHTLFVDGRTYLCRPAGGQPAPTTTAGTMPGTTSVSATTNVQSNGGCDHHRLRRELAA